MLRIEQLLYLEQEQKFLSEILHKNKVFAKIHFGKNETIKFEKYSNEYNVFFTWNFKLQQKENLFYLISDIHYQYLDTLSGFIEGEFQKKEPFIEPKLISTKQVDDILKAWCRNNDIYMGKIIGVVMINLLKLFQIGY